MALLLVACSASSGPPSGPTALPSATSAPARPGSHVFVVVMENRDYATALAQPYTTQLAHRYAVATNYHAIAHPSLPNYLALTSGATFGISDDDFHRLPSSLQTLAEARAGCTDHQRQQRNSCSHQSS